jgi:hypothetical protein
MSSILCKMPIQERNERCQSYNHEEWQTGNSGCLSDVWHQDVQNRKELIYSGSMTTITE